MINVYFRMGGHPCYNDIANYPPDGVRYTVSKLFTGRGGSHYSEIYKMKKMLFNFYIKLGGDINAVSLRCKEDIIFSAGGLMVKTKKPWVTDVEQSYALVGYRQWDRNIEAIKRKTLDLIRKSNCKILPWSIAAKKSIQNFFETHKIDDKLEVVYPAMPVGNLKIRKDDKIKILYVNRRFYGKSGRETLFAFDSISKKYDVELLFVSKTPYDMKKKFRKNKKIKFIDVPIPREKVLEMYNSSHIFVLPTLYDCFGIVFLEAMAAGLPIIATDIFAVNEIVINGENGLLIKPDVQLYNKKYLHAYRDPEDLFDYIKKNRLKNIENQLKEKMVELIESKSKRLKYGMTGRKMVESGKFSLRKRNDQLKRIYEELIRK